MDTQNQSNDYIYISYRRSQDKYIAMAMAMYLQQQGYRVWQDVQYDSSDMFNTEYKRSINDAIRHCSDFILLMGDGYRPEDSFDWLGAELELAMHYGCHVVPVIAKGISIEQVLPKYSNLIASEVCFQLPDNMMTLHDDLFKDQLTKILKTTPTNQQ